MERPGKSNISTQSIIHECNTIDTGRQTVSEGEDSGRTGARTGVNRSRILRCRPIPAWVVSRTGGRRVAKLDRGGRDTDCDFPLSDVWKADAPQGAQAMHADHNAGIYHPTLPGLSLHASQGSISRSRSESTPTLIALFDVALSWLTYVEIGIGEKARLRHNDRIIDFSPAEDGASPWLWSQSRCQDSTGSYAHLG